MARHGVLPRGMVGIMDRRRFIGAAAAAAGTLAVPAKVFAQPSGLDSRSTAILEIARREVARAGDVLWRRDVAGIADFGVHSARSEERRVGKEWGSRAWARE